jgi:hypothetical protein
MALADCVIFNCHGLDCHESPDSNQHIKVIAEKGNDKGQVLGVPCFSFLYNDENTTPDHSGVLIKRVCGNMKNTTVGLTRKSQSILRLKLALTMRRFFLIYSVTKPLPIVFSVLLTLSLHMTKTLMPLRL